MIRSDEIVDVAALSRATETAAMVDNTSQKSGSDGTYKRLGRIIIFKAICVIGAALAGLAVAEIYFRLGDPSKNYWTISQLMSSDPSKKLDYAFDANLGYRPLLGGKNYDALGTQINGYGLDKPPGVYRVLFLGDSVTARGKLIAALEATYRDESIEYWNAGVEGFDASQEVAYYEHFAYRVRPDHVVLTFHTNDFTPQTVADFDDHGRITFYGADCGWSVRLPWLLRQSELVRWSTATRFRSLARSSDRVEHSLRRLSSRLAAEGTVFSIVLLPLFQTPDGWSRGEVLARERALAIFNSVGLRYFDALPAVETALREGIDVCELPGDTWHPNRFVCDRMARQLADEGLFERQPSDRLAARHATANAKTR
jgi:hypothetical protein